MRQSGGRDGHPTAASQALLILLQYICATSHEMCQCLNVQIGHVKYSHHLSSRDFSSSQTEAMFPLIADSQPAPQPLHPPAHSVCKHWLLPGPHLRGTLQGVPFGDRPIPPSPLGRTPGSPRPSSLSLWRGPHFTHSAAGGCVPCFHLVVTVTANVCWVCPHVGRSLPALPSGPCQKRSPDHTGILGSTR